MKLLQLSYKVGLLFMVLMYLWLYTILRGRQKLGWVYRRSTYCQLIRTVNKQKILEWSTMYLHDNFEDVIRSDKTTVQLQTHLLF